MLTPGGNLIGDDYFPNGEWPEVRAAFDAFFSEQGISLIDVAMESVLSAKEARAMMQFDTSDCTCIEA